MLTASSYSFFIRLSVADDLDGDDEVDVDDRAVLEVSFFVRFSDCTRSEGSSDDGLGIDVFASFCVIDTFCDISTSPFASNGRLMLEDGLLGSEEATQTCLQNKAETPMNLHTRFIRFYSFGYGSNRTIFSSQIVALVMCLGPERMNILCLITEMAMQKLPIEETNL